MRGSGAHLSPGPCARWPPGRPDPARGSARPLSGSRPERSARSRKSKVLSIHPTTQFTPRRAFPRRSPAPRTPRATSRVTWPLRPRGGSCTSRTKVADTISGYAVDETTAGLIPLAGAPFAAGDAPDGLMVDVSSRFLYAANSGSSNVSAFSIGEDGSLTTVPGSPFLAGFGFNAFEAAIAGTNHDPIFKDGFQQAKPGRAGWPSHHGAAPWKSKDRTAGLPALTDRSFVSLTITGPRRRRSRP